MAGSSRWNKIVLDSMTFLLDTNTIIALLDPARRETLLARITSRDPGQVVTSAIVSHVMQLPRTWHKVLLEANGFLNDDYPACGDGLDRDVLDALGLDRDEIVAYLRAELPAYMDFERWVLDKIGEVAREKLEAFQTIMQCREHPEPKRTGIHVTDCNRAITNLEDWRYAYDLVIAPIERVE